MAPGENGFDTPAIDAQSKIFSCVTYSAEPGFSPQVRILVIFQSVG